MKGTISASFAVKDRFFSNDPGINVREVRTNLFSQIPS